MTNSPGPHTITVAFDPAYNVWVATVRDCAGNKLGDYTGPSAYDVLNQVAPVVDRSTAAQLTELGRRTCPACGILAAAPGDRYCAGCGSARDRSAWVDGPEGPTLYAPLEQQLQQAAHLRAVAPPPGWTPPEHQHQLVAHSCGAAHCACITCEVAAQYQAADEQLLGYAR